MSKGIESRTFLWSSASFKIIKIGIKLLLVRRFEMNKTHHCVHFRISAPFSKIEFCSFQPEIFDNNQFYSKRARDFYFFHPNGWFCIKKEEIRRKKRWSKMWESFHEWMVKRHVSRELLILLLKRIKNLYPHWNSTLFRLRLIS